jgi:hypothetical protein
MFWAMTTIATLAAVQFDDAADREHADALDELLDQCRMKLLAPLLVDLAQAHWLAT